MVASVNDKARARELLSTKQYTVVAVLGETEITDKRRGVKPILDWIDSGKDMKSYAIADKVVGKGTALLYCLLGAGSVYAPVMTKAAIEVFESHAIEAEYDDVVELVKNRDQTGRCPIDSSVVDVEDPEVALGVIRDTLKRLAS